MLTFYTMTNVFTSDLQCAHVVNLFKCVVTEVVLFSIVAFKTLDISQGSVAKHLRCDGILVIVFLQISPDSDSEIILKIG